jgi:Zn-finger nucleic acid-binding protein
MLCPHCKQELKPTERQGIEIDYCPNCRGIWLDRGELDKLLDRSAAMMPTQAAPTGYPAPPPQTAYAPPPQYGGRRRYDDDDDYDDDDRRRYYGQPDYDPRRRRRSWLGDLFDFD